MPILPDRVQDLLDFAEVHVPVFEGAFAQIGISEEQANLFKVAAETARIDYRDAYAANNAKKAATQRSRSSMSALRKTAGETIALIKAFAEAQSSPTTVYDAAQLPAPQPPAPVGPPGSPTTFTVGLRQDGAVMLAWKCRNPSNSFGTMYEVRRRVAGGGSGESGNTFEFVGATGKRAFTDDRLPSGATNVIYQITAVRSTSRGAPAQFNVNFGTSTAGVPFVMMSPQEVKRAA